MADGWSTVYGSSSISHSNSLDNPERIRYTSAMHPHRSIADKIRLALRLDWALRIVWSAAPGWMSSSMGLSVCEGLLPLLVIYLVKRIVDAVSAGMVSPGPHAASNALLWVAVAAGAALLAALCHAASGLVREAQVAAVTDHVADALHARSVEVDLGYYEDARFYDALHRAQQEAPYRPARIVDGLTRLAQNALTLLAMAGLLVHFRWWVAAVLLLVSLPGVILRLRHSDRLFDWQRRRTVMERQSWYYHWLLTDGGAAKEVRLFDLGGLFRDRYRALRDKLRRERIGLGARRSAADLLAQLAGTAAVFGSFAVIAVAAVRGLITLGDLVMYFAAVQRGLASLQEVLGGVAALYEDNLFLSNYFEFMSLQPTVREPASPRPIPRPLRSGIAFEAVTFRYPSENRPVLSELSLRIEPGQVAALVGTNGAGKTTLIKLLCRLYDPEAGRITLDGVDIRDFHIADLRGEIGILFQDFVRYNLPARENIWLGDRRRDPRDPRVETAALQAGADPTLGRLPQRYETVLGHWFEEGHELSAGEWQKVALARAFLRDAPILVLDEPTSALDALAEAEVFDAFRRLSAGRTAILVSHRFSTVRLADRIFVLADGRLAESGNHAELMAAGGLYAAMFTAQSRNYL
jgi:ATP-binding cassette subfamily B protein